MFALPSAVSLPMTVSWVPSADQIPDFLWSACFPPPLEGRWWYQILEKSKLEEQFTFSYAVLYKGDQPIGIAPTFVMDVPIDLVAPTLIAALLKKVGAYLPRLRYQRTLFVGSPCADEGTIGCLPGIELRHVVATLYDALLERANEVKSHMIVWKDLPKECGSSLERMALPRKVFKVISYPGTRVRLDPGGDFERYLKQLSSSHRHNLRKKLRRSREASRLISSVVQDPSEAVLDNEILPLFWQTYHKGTTKFEKLTRTFFSLVARLPSSYFVLLRSDERGNLVAFMLCFRLGSRVINKFIGIDYACDSSWFLYFRLWEAAVCWALSANASEIQSGQTGYRAKIDVGHSLVPLNTYCHHRNPLVHFVFARVARSISWSSLDNDLRIYLEAHKEIGEEQYT